MNSDFRWEDFYPRLKWSIVEKEINACMEIQSDNREFKQHAEMNDYIELLHFQNTDFFFCKINTYFDGF